MATRLDPHDASGVTEAPRVTGVIATPAAGVPLARYGTTAVLSAVTLSHFVNDGATSLLNPFLPHIRDAYGVSIAQTGILVAVLSFTGSMIQPFTGALADRMDRRILASVGPVIAVAAMALMGYSATFGGLVALLALAGLGSALFHPSGAVYAVMRVRPDRRGLFASLFSSGGTAGLAVGPLLSCSACGR
jgi:MFS transporter, FSR family, fosmidomycin resistance protein